MEEARSRLLQAREQVGITKAEKLPWVNAAGGWVRGEMPDDITRGILPAQLQNMPLGIEGSNSATYAGLDASWELDLFGKKSAKVREARGALEAQRGMLYSTWVSLSAEVAMNYITLRTLQAELDVTEKSIANMKENLSLMQVNQESGLVSSVPVDQLTYTLKETEAQIPELKSSIAGTMSKIAILTGTTPGALDAMLMTPKPLPDIDPTLYNAIPADVLRQRPDVYAAESAWAAQIAKTDEAKAEMKPKISILGVLGLATLGTGGLFSAGSRAFGIMPQVTFPLFNGGALRRNVNVQSENTTELGGVKDVQIAIRAKGTPAPEDGVWASMKYEGGVHRVQRIPVTESQGRIQTSAAGVIVFPEADEDDDEIEIDPKDLKIDIFMSSGPGGQSVNTTYSAVRMTHLPTGITVNMQDEKSQIQNRAAALRVLKSRLLAMKHEQEAAEAADMRHSQVRSLDRSERIRTYNFPENRIVDHRTNYKAYNLDAVLDGDLQAVIDSDIQADEADRLANQK